MKRNYLYDIIKLEILIYQNREIYSSSEQLIVAAIKLMVFTKFRLIYFREKVCDMRPKIFAFFRETFRSLETISNYFYFYL